VRDGHAASPWVEHLVRYVVPMITMQSPSDAPAGGDDG
jgi:hypothetical protein